MTDFIGILAIIATIINLWYSYYERVENFFWNIPSYGLIAVGMFVDHAYATSIKMMLITIISLYGFFIWTKQRNHTIKEMLLSTIYDCHHQKHQQYATFSMSPLGHMYALIAITGLTICTYYILSLFVQNDISPIMDSLSFSITIVATILLNHKRLESWLYYAVSGMLSVTLAAMAIDWYNIISMLLFTVFDTVTFFRWRAQMKSLLSVAG